MSEKDDDKKIQISIDQQDRFDSLKRRDFLKILSASFAALSIPACNLKKPEEKIIPYMEQPEELVPGKASWYASTCGSCTAACGILVKNRDGRPIKIEGNPDHPLSRGGLCARGQASLLDLYDSERLKGPLKNGQAIQWTKVDEEIKNQLEEMARSKGSIRILSSTISSPTQQKVLRDFKKKYPTTRHVTVDALNYSSVLEAHEKTHGRYIFPHYHINEARVLVSFDADFLGNWISPVEFTKDWVKNRRTEKPYDLMSWHVQFEARMSLSGANADLRVPLKPSNQYATVLALGKMIEEKILTSGRKYLPSAPLPSEIDPDVLRKVANELLNATGECLVVSSSSNRDEQIAVNWINEMLDNYGKTVDLERPSYQHQSDQDGINNLLEEMEAGKIKALILLDANPVYNSSQGERFSKALEKVSLSISLSDRKDETAEHVSYVCPDHNFLESWRDARPVLGIYSLTQPLMAPLYNTRASMESLSAWMGRPSKAYDLIKQTWKKSVFPKQKENKTFLTFWDKAVQMGVLSIEEEPASKRKLNKDSLRLVKKPQDFENKNQLELVVYPSVAMADGRQANNPWLQELPDPVTKVTWGNYVSVSPQTAKVLNVVEGRVVKLKSESKEIQLSAHIQPGIPEGVAAVALGYGRKNAGKIAANYPMEKMFSVDKKLLAGENLFPFLMTSLVSIQPTSKMNLLAKTQTFDKLKVPFTNQKRPFVQDTTVQELAANPPKENNHPSKEISMWTDHKYEGHKWAMAIDLNACTGCSGCSVGCQVENNVPIVGKAEIQKGRDMQWIRVDRYYGTGKETKDQKSPNVAFQPMLCQHCDNAPCETVCPVAATVHSSEGLNMQVYNRCVGTRYCANNCPYKVRRFNWFDYAHNDLIQNMALNPDITVRSRGIMEKCSFCVQRIMEGKAQAKDKGRKVNDGEISPACAQSCPSDAIVFGDINDPKSKVSQMATDSRRYTVLKELGVGPNVHYLSKVRNKKV